jgi:peptide subunit release factor 1 (eRF1)
MAKGKRNRSKIRRDRTKQVRKLYEDEIDRHTWKLGDECFYCDAQEYTLNHNKNAASFTIRCKNCQGYIKIVDYQAVIDYESLVGSEV